MSQDIVAALTSLPGQPKKALRQYGQPYSDAWGYSPGPREPIVAFDRRDVEQLYIKAFWILSMIQPAAGVPS